jgi:hypothetical protein
MAQYPMAFNYPGPFNLKGTPNATYILQADAAGNLTIAAGGGGASVSLPTVTNGIVFATDTSGDLTTNANGTLDSSGNMIIAGGLNVGAGDNFAIDGAGSLMVTSAACGTLVILTGGTTSGDDWSIEANGAISFDNGTIQSDGSGHLTAVSLTTTAFGTSFFVPSGTSDPGSPTAGQIWVNGTSLKFCDNTGTVQTVTST